MRSAIAIVLTAAVWPALCQAQGVTAGNLPAPIVTKNSVETCLNSRYSQHSLSKTPATAQQISNILWAAGRAPITGAYRNIYVATPGGTYLYNPAGHSLSWYSSEVTSDGGFAIVYDAQRPFDAGVMFMPAIPATQIPQAIVSLGPIAASTSLPGDANCDNRVDLDDYAILSQSWLSSKPQPAYDARADFNRDGLINVADLCLLAANWLKTAP
jgi:hypothetical protein